MLCSPTPQIRDPHLVIGMDCSADTMTDRLRRRSQGSPHADDSTAIAKRLETYYRASIPVMAYYETKTQLRKVKHFTFLLQNKPITPPFFF